MAKDNFEFPFAAASPAGMGKYLFDAWETRKAE